MEKRKKASKTLDAKKEETSSTGSNELRDTGEPDAFAGADKLVRAARAEGLKPSSVRSWLKRNRHILFTNQLERTLNATE